MPNTGTLLVCWLRYDAAKTVDLKGTVTKVEWMNPHARFYVDVKDEGGGATGGGARLTNWEFEPGQPERSDVL